jgi:hypothetical protein
VAAEDREIEVRFPGFPPITIRASYSETTWEWIATAVAEIQGGSREVVDLTALGGSAPYICFGNAVTRLADLFEQQSLPYQRSTSPR